MNITNQITEFLPVIRSMAFDNRFASAGIILAIFFALSWIALEILEKIFMKLADKTDTDVDNLIISAIKRPLSLIILMFGFNLFFIELWSGLWFEKYLESLVFSIIAFIATFAIIRVILIFVDNGGSLFHKRTKSAIDKQLIKLSHKLISFGAYVIALLWILSIWGVQIGPLLAGLGIGGLAVAFALQPVLSNIFSGISLILDKSIKEGDIINLEGDVSGIIYDIGIRSTKIKSWSNEIIIIPNSKLVDSKITNLDQPDRTIRVEIKFGVAYGSKIEKVKKLALNCLKRKKHVLKEPAPYVWFTEMGDSSLNFVLRFYADDISNKWELHQKVITQLYDDLNKAKINIPFPQREIWVHNLKK